jgi:hypothetical protein
VTQFPGERGSIGIIWLENKIFNPKKCRGASLGAPQKGGHTCLPVGREGRPYELINQFSWLLATRQGHECFLSNRSGMSEKRIEVIEFGIDEDWSIP